MRTTIVAVAFCLIVGGAACAQLPGGGALGGVGALGGMPSVSQAGTGNVAGVLRFCVKNNYLSGRSASGVAQSLMGKKSQSDSGFQSGSRGLLDTGGGQHYQLGGGGLKDELTRKVCDQVLQHGKSLL